MVNYLLIYLQFLHDYSVDHNDGSLLPRTEYCNNYGNHNHITVIRHFSFILGSLAAILAFACPLSHMITLMNASHLLGISMQAFHFIIMRCVPTTEQIEAGGKLLCEMSIVEKQFRLI